MSLARRKLCAGAFTWSLFYSLAILAEIIVFGVVSLLLSWLSMTSTPLAIALAVPITVLILIVVVGMVNAFFFARIRAKKFPVNHRRAFGAYMLVVLLANLVYLGFVMGFAVVMGAFC